MADVCFLLLCGLPGSGKTRLTKTLVDLSGNQPSDLQGCNSRVMYHFIIIEYDRLLPVQVEKHLILQHDGHDNNVSPWKRYRNDIISCINSLLAVFATNGDHKVSKTKVSAILKPTNVAEELWEKFQDVLLDNLTDRGVDQGKVCIVIDDNLYYRSMRYKYYQLARQYRAGFCQVYLHCDKEVAITQNAQRDVHVTDDIIIGMATRFEEPDCVQNPWEKYSITMATRNYLVEDIYSLINLALENPVQPVPEVDVESQNQSREICSASFLHQSDQILRKLVSQEMASAKGKNLSKCEMKALASTVQVRRKEVLERLRLGSIVIPEDILAASNDASKDTNNAVYEFLKTFIK